MANDKTEKPPKAGSAKRPTTIDLKATEIKAAAKAAAKPETIKPESLKPEMAEPEAVKPEPAKPQEMPQAKQEEQPYVEAAAPPQSEARSEGARSQTQSLPWPLIAASALGAVVLFAIGIGAGHWLSREMQVAQVPVAPTQSAASPELLERLAKLEAAVAAPRAPDSQLVARIAAAEASAKTATEMAAARERRSDEIAVMAREARDRASSAATTADEAAQKARAAAPEQSRAELESVVSRLAAIETVTRANQAEIAKRANATVNDDRSRIAIAALSLRNAVDSGAPFPAELAAMRALNGDAKSIAALEPFAESGLPTAASLGRELQAAMPAIWKAARTSEPTEGSFLERLQANAERIVRVRPAGEAAGDDAPSVKARLEMRAGNADIRGALLELSKLPPDARAPAQSWIKKVEARNAAIAAAQSLAQSALAALAKPGS
jgi:hypothetical protein